MLTLEGFMNSLKMLNRGFGKKACQDTANLYYSMCRKKLPEVDDFKFQEIVDEILYYEKYFPTFSKIVEYYHKITKEKRVQANTDCEYCNGRGNVSVEVFEQYYGDYIVINIRCVCVPKIEGFTNLGEKNIKQKIDAGKLFLDRDMVYRQPGRARFDVQRHITKTEKVPLKSTFL